MCNQPVPVVNHWYSFNPVEATDVNMFCHHGSNGGLCLGDLRMENIGTSPVFNQIACNTANFIRFYPSQPTDVGKTVTLFGIDGDGQVIRSQRTDGTFQDGVVITLAIPYATTTFAVRRVDRIIKDLTDGPLRAFQWDSTNNVLLDLATWDASETVPDYRVSRLHRCDCGSCCTEQITALVKLAFVPVVNDDDLVLIEDIDALAVMMQAIKRSDSYDDDGAEKAIARAVHEANLALRNRLPIDQTPARVSIYGTADLRREFIGSLI